MSGTRARIYINAPEGCQRGTHTKETAYPLGTYKAQPMMTSLTVGFGAPPPATAAMVVARRYSGRRRCRHSRRRCCRRGRGRGRGRPAPPAPRAPRPAPPSRP
eukprot:scaffold43102_cov60-Phaeocystis_antarctica.AAC.2